MNAARVKNLFDRFPLLLPTITKLNTESIEWMIGGSSCLYVFGNERLPDDVDIFFRNEDHDSVDQLFGISSYTHDAKEGPVRNSNPGKDHSIQFTSNLIINVAGKSFDLAVTDEIVAGKIAGNYHGQNFWLMPPEEVLLFKALLQRGSEAGKKDLEDIKNFLKIYPNIRWKYLKKRIKILEALKRTKDIFKAYLDDNNFEI